MSTTNPIPFDVATMRLVNLVVDLAEAEAAEFEARAAVSDACAEFAAAPSPATFRARVDAEKAYSEAAAKAARLYRNARINIALAGAKQSQKGNG